MSYHIYTTPGIILKRTPFGESNILLHILTEDLGLIMASARSARLFISKLRPALQEYTLALISCIKGRGGWKITNVIFLNSFYFEYPVFTHKVISQVTTVLIKMIQGETPHKEVFKIVKNGFVFLKNVKEEMVVNFETLIVLRILNELGYVVSDDSTFVFLNNDWNDELLIKINLNKKSIVAVINKALKESQL